MAHNGSWLVHCVYIYYIYMYIRIYPMIISEGLKHLPSLLKMWWLLCFCWKEQPLDCLDHVDPLDSRPCLDRLGHLDPRDLKKGPIAVSSHIFSVSKPVPWATCPLQMDPRNLTIDNKGSINIYYFCLLSFILESAIFWINHITWFYMILMDSYGIFWWIVMDRHGVFRASKRSTGKRRLQWPGSARFRESWESDYQLRSCLDYPPFLMGKSMIMGVLMGISWENWIMSSMVWLTMSSNCLGLWSFGVGYVAGSLFFACPFRPDNQPQERRRKSEVTTWISLHLIEFGRNMEK